MGRPPRLSRAARVGTGVRPSRQAQRGALRGPAVNGSASTDSPLPPVLPSRTIARHFSYAGAPDARSPPLPLDRSHRTCHHPSLPHQPPRPTRKDSAPPPTIPCSIKTKTLAEIRRQFLIPEDEIYLNNGTVGSSPAPVLRAIFDGYTTTEKMDQDPEDYPIWGYASRNEFRDPLAAFVGCNRDEIALLRNATEANSYIANGLDMKPGDEVLMTDQGRVPVA
jgi:hypothetical protein